MILGVQKKILGVSIPTQVETAFSSLGLEIDHNRIEELAQRGAPHFSLERDVQNRVSDSTFLCGRISAVFVTV